MLIPKTEYIRDQRYLNTVRGKPCLVCYKVGEAHHLNHAQEHGISMKVGDNWTVPLCHKCHMELQDYGDEVTWWDLQGIEPLAWAKFNWETYGKQTNKDYKNVN